MKTSLIIFPLLFFAIACSGSGNDGKKQITNSTAVSGSIVNGLRVLEMDPARPRLSFKVYRGDYIKPVMKDQAGFTIEFPALKVKKTYPVVSGKKEYIKMKKTGRFAFTIGGKQGTIEVVEYSRPQYRSVRAGEAAAIIKNISPLILDVRTPGEYAGGHLKGALLMPVQIIQQDFSRIIKYMDRPVLIYCASGNRSTVASKILIDNGFKKIYNMRYGINEWYNDNLPVEQ